MCNQKNRSCDSDKMSFCLLHLPFIFCLTDINHIPENHVVGLHWFCHERRHHSVFCVRRAHELRSGYDTVIDLCTTNDIRVSVIHSILKFFCTDFARPKLVNLLCVDCPIDSCPRNFICLAGRFSCKVKDLLSCRLYSCDCTDKTLRDVAVNVALIFEPEYIRCPVSELRSFLPVLSYYSGIQIFIRNHFSCAEDGCRLLYDYTSISKSSGSFRVPRQHIVEVTAYKAALFSIVDRRDELHEIFLPLLSVEVINRILYRVSESEFLTVLSLHIRLFVVIKEADEILKRSSPRMVGSHLCHMIHVDHKDVSQNQRVVCFRSNVFGESGVLDRIDRSLRDVAVPRGDSVLVCRHREIVLVNKLLVPVQLHTSLVALFRALMCKIILHSICHLLLLRCQCIRNFFDLLICEVYRDPLTGYLLTIGLICNKAPDLMLLRIRALRQLIQRHDLCRCEIEAIVVLGLIHPAFHFFFSCKTIAHISHIILCLMDISRLLVLRPIERLCDRIRLFSTENSMEICLCHSTVKRQCINKRSHRFKVLSSALHSTCRAVHYHVRNIRDMLRGLGIHPIYLIHRMQDVSNYFIQRPQLTRRQLRN